MLNRDLAMPVMPVVSVISLSNSNFVNIRDVTENSILFYGKLF